MPSRRYERLPPKSEQGDKPKKRKKVKPTGAKPEALSPRKRDLARPHNVEDLNALQLRALAKMLDVEIPAGTNLQGMYEMVMATGIEEAVTPEIYAQLPWEGPT